MRARVLPVRSVVVLILAFCAAGANVKPQQPFTAVVGPVIVAHRGGSLEAPENTVQAVQHGSTAGADWVEIDVGLSADDQAIVIHDDTLERTTNGSGEVRSTKWADLQKLDAGAPTPAPGTIAMMAAVGVSPTVFGGAFAGARIPKLSQVLAVEDIRFMVELKKTDNPRMLVRRVLEAVRETGTEDRVAVGSFDPELLWAVNQDAPYLPLIGIASDMDGVSRMLNLPIKVLAINEGIADEALRKAPAGLAVWAWTVYSVDVAVRLRDLGVHGLITDAPKALVTAMRPDSETLYIERGERQYVEPIK